MPEPEDPQSRPDDRLVSLDQQVKDALQKQETRDAAEEALAARAAKNRQAGEAWRLMIDLVIATALVGAIGLGLDRLVGLTPWGMIVGLFLGFGLGMYLVVRRAAKMQADAQTQPKGDE